MISRTLRILKGQFYYDLFLLHSSPLISITRYYRYYIIVISERISV